MGNEAYDARRAAEKAKADLDKATAETGAAAMQAFFDFLRGKATISVSPNGLGGGVGWKIRLVRD